MVSSVVASMPAAAVIATAALAATGCGFVVASLSAASFVTAVSFL